MVGKKVFIASAMMMLAGCIPVTSYASSRLFDSDTGFIERDGKYSLGFLEDNAYIGGLQDVALGNVIEDGAKYVIQDGDLYYPVSYFSSDDEYKASWAMITEEGVSSKEEALNNASPVPKGAKFYLKVADASAKLIVQSTDGVLSEYLYSELGNDITKDTYVPSGTVSVDEGNITDNGTELKISWSLNSNAEGQPDTASYFKILEDDYLEYLDGVNSGEQILVFDGDIGTYNYELYTVSGNSYKGQFTISKSSDITASKDKAVKSKKLVKPTLKAKTVTKNKKVYVTVTSDIPAVITFNGKTDNRYVKKAKFEVNENGKYYISGVSKSGQESSLRYKVKAFDKKKDSKIAFDRDNYWTDRVTELTNKASELVKTGLYNYKVWVISALLMIAGCTILMFRKLVLRKGLKDNESIR